MLSQLCEGCEQLQLCKVRFFRVQPGEYCYCPNGERKLVEEPEIG